MSFWTGERANSPNFVYLVSQSKGISTEAAKTLIRDTDCPPSAASLEIKAKAAALKSSWVTTGFYTGPEMGRAITALANCSKQASDVAIHAFSLGGDSSLSAAATKFYTTWGSKLVDYSEKARQATNSGAVLDAPTFKSFVIGFMNATYDLMRKAEYEVCIAPWWAGAIAAVAGFIRAAYDIIVSIGKVVVAIGQTLIKVGGGLAVLWPVFKWGGLAVGALVVGVFTYNKVITTTQWARDAGRKPIEWGKLFRLKKSES